jgi:glycine cleavage system H protein
VALGDIAFVDVPQVAHDLAMGDSFGSVESVDVYAPVSGTIVDINEVILDKPGFVNK